MCNIGPYITETVFKSLNKFEVNFTDLLDLFQKHDLFTVLKFIGKFDRSPPRKINNCRKKQSQTPILFSSNNKKYEVKSFSECPEQLLSCKPRDPPFY